MYTPINGFTKSSILKVLKSRKFNEPAVRAPDDSSCVYLAPDGNKCAVGMFIPDGHAGQNLANTADELLVHYPDLVALMPFGPEGLVSLQTAHDVEASFNKKFEGNAKAAMIDWVEKNVQDDAA